MNSYFVRIASGLVSCAAILATAVHAAEPAVAASPLENLRTALTLDTAAKVQYEAFAGTAKQEGYVGIALLFKGAADAKSIRIAKVESAIKSLGGDANIEAAEAPEVKTTRENLESAIKAENAATEQLSAFADQAEAGKDKKVVMVFKGSVAVSASRIKLLESAAKDPEAWKADKTVFVCEVCGELIIDSTIKQCPICSAPRSKFERMK